MSFYREHVYPHLVSMLGNPKPIAEIRKRIVPLAQGDVLEIGVGPGVNFAHYDPAKVTKVYALEPNPGMFSRADEQRRATSLRQRGYGYQHLYVMHDSRSDGCHSGFEESSETGWQVHLFRAWTRA